MYAIVVAYMGKTWVRGLLRALAILAVLTIGQALVLAQAIADPVHVVPLAPATSAADTHPLKKDVDLVLVNVTVTDPEGRIISDLNATNFSIQDEKRPQPIKYFSREDTPISVTVVLDTSNSMEENFEQVRSAAIEFFRASNPQDEFGVIAFSDRPHVVADFTNSIADIEPVLWPLEPHGHTARWDALYLAVTQMRTAHYPKRAVLVISDGGDNQSRYTEDDIKKFLQEADVQVYAIDLYKPYPKTSEERFGLVALDDVTSASGGCVFLVHSPAELHQAIRQVSRELRNQYVLGYPPPATAHDGRWHKIKVGVNVAHERKLHVYAKKGYYGPDE